MSGLLVHSPAYILHSWMKGHPTIYTGTWLSRGFVNNDPADTSPYIVLSDVAGDIQGRDHISGKSIEFYGIQIRVRSAQQECYTKIKGLQRILEELKNQTFTITPNTYIIHAVTFTSPVIRVGKEQPGDNRFIYSLNCKASITMTT